MKDNKFLKIFIMFVLGLLLFELGLQLRGFIESKRQESNQKTNDLNILLIGDSVLGNFDSDGSLASQIRKHLTISSNKFNFSIMSSGAYSSGKVNEEIDQVLEKKNPSIVVILLGNSDYTVALDENIKMGYLKKMRIALFRVLNKSYIFKFVLNQATKVENFFKYKAFVFRYSLLKEVPWYDFEKNPSDFRSFTYIKKLKKKIQDVDIRQLKQEAWEEFLQNKCDKLIKNYQIIFEYLQSSKRELNGIKECYIKENRLAEGIEFFNKLIQTEDINYSYIRYITYSFRLMLKKDSAQNILNEIEQSTEHDRDYYISKLYYFKSTDSSDEANKLYLEKDRYGINNGNLIDTKNFSEIVKKVLKGGRRLIVLQYPNQPDWPVEEVLLPYGNDDRVKFISTSKIIEGSLDKLNINEILEDDLMHLTGVGSETIGKGIAIKINQLTDGGKWKKYENF